MVDPLPMDRLHLRLVKGGYQVITQDWNRYRGVSYPYWSCYINSKSGASLRLSDGRLHAVTPDRAHLIPAWMRWDCVLEHDTPHLWAMFDLVGLPGNLVRECFPVPRAVPLTPHLGTAAERARVAFGCGTLDDPETLFAMKSLLYGVVSDLFGSLDAERKRRLFAILEPENPVAPALELIERRLAQPVANHALARACGFSEHHFIRTFRRHLGQTPGQYTLERRIARAAEQLALEHQTIEGIAKRWGFTDRYHFTRMFSKRMGVSPGAYRRMTLVAGADSE